MKTKADLIIRHARIYTVDQDFSIAESLAVRDGKIVAVGTDKEITATFIAAQEIDLNGSVVYPGFIDAHCHFFGYGTNLLRNVDLTGTGSFDEVLQLLVAYRQKHTGEWLLGRGWDQNDWPVQEFPDNARLDSLFPGVPVYLKRIDGHAALASSEALKRAGITPQTRIPGGEVEVREGRLTGIVLDNAMDSVSEVIPELTIGERCRALLMAQEKCLAVGLTAVVDAGLDVDTIRSIDSLQQSGELKLRIDAMLNPTDNNVAAYFPLGVFQSDRLRVGSIKLYADGALGSRGACLLEPYSDAQNKQGFMLHDPEYYREWCRRAYDAGYQVNTHAIGDSANRFVLNTYASFLGGRNDRRWRIEHAQIVNPDDFHLFGDFSIVPSVQTTHATSDMYWANERLGGNRMAGAYAYQVLLAQNGWLPNGTDFPVEHIHPLYTFYAAVFRKDHDGFPDNGFQPENALSREDALRSMTIWAAMGSFLESQIGSIEPGKWADLVVLDQDIMTIMDQDVLKVHIMKTFIAGEEVYSAP